MSIPNNPIVNAGLLYVNGLQIANTSNTIASKKLTLTPGNARDINNIDDIILSSTLTLNGAMSGANAVDANPFIANKFYAVYVIGDSTGHKSTAGLFALATQSSPFLPAGYDMFRRVGWILTDGSANIVTFYQSGINENRMYYYEIPINVATNISPTSYEAIPLTNAVPPIPSPNSLFVPNEVLLNVIYTPAIANNSVQFARNDSFLNQLGIIQFGCGVAALQIGTISVPTTHLPFQRINCLVDTGDLLTLNVVGYTDYLS